MEELIYTTDGTYVVKIIQGRTLAWRKLNLHPFYVMLSIYIILYTAFLLTIIKLPIFPIVNRVTFFDVVFSWSITGSLQLDILVASIFFSASIIFLYRRYISLLFASINLLVPFVAYITTNNYAQYAANILIISSLPIIAGLLVISTRTKAYNGAMLFAIKHKKSLQFDVHEFLTVFFITLVILELIVFVRWSAYAVFVDQPSQHWSWRLNILDNNLFYAFGLLSPHLIVMSLVSFILRPYLYSIAKRLKQLLRDLRLFSEDEYIVPLSKENKIFKNPRLGNGALGLSLFQSEHRTILLTVIFSVLFSIMFVLYPYSVSPSQDTVLGVDVPFYVNTLKHVSNSNPLSILSELFVKVDGGGRAIPLLAMYVTQIVSNESLDVVAKYFPAILGTLLCLAAYFLTRTAYPEKRQLAFLTAIMTAISHQLVIGFYSGFYANWFALIFSFTACIFLLKSLNGTRKYIAIFGILTLLIIFTHTYTWSYLIMVIALFLIWTGIQYKRKGKSLKIIIILAVVITGTVLIDQIRSYYTGFTSLDKDLTLAGSSISPDQFAIRWANLNTTFRLYVGGFLTNSVLLVLLFLWTLKSDYKHDSDRLLLSMLFVGILPILFGNHLVQTRILYNIPFQIPVSIIMYKIYTKPGLLYGKPLFFALLIMQFNYVLRAMANMNLVIPT